MTVRDDPPEETEETVAALQMELDRDGVSARRLVAGAVLLANLDYVAAAREYAARALLAGRKEEDEESTRVAAAMLLTLRQERGLA